MTTSPKLHITYELHGVHVSAEDCTWYLIAPCGCTCGSTVVMSHFGSDHTLTEEDAMQRFYSDSREQMVRDRALGFHVELGLLEESQARMSLEAKCPHDPKYGVHETPIPEGYTWAGRSGSSRMHLVPGVKDRERRYLLGEDDLRMPNYKTEPIRSLCNQVSQYWSTHWSHDEPTCRACEKKANKRAGVTSKSSVTAQQSGAGAELGQGSTLNPGDQVGEHL